MNNTSSQDSVSSGNSLSPPVGVLETQFPDSIPRKIGLAVILDCGSYSAKFNDETWFERSERLETIAIDRMHVIDSLKKNGVDKVFHVPLSSQHAAGMKTPFQVRLHAGKFKKANAEKEIAIILSEYIVKQLLANNDTPVEEENGASNILICVVGNEELNFHFRNAVQVACDLPSDAHIFIYAPRDAKCSELFSRLSCDQKYASKISIISMPSPAGTGYYLSKEEVADSRSKEKGEVLVLIDLDNFNTEPQKSFSELQAIFSALKKTASKWMTKTGEGTEQKEFAKHMEFRVYTTVEDASDQWLALKREFEFVEIFAGTFPDKEKSDYDIIRDCYDFIGRKSSSVEFLHIFLVSSDKDFHNLFFALKEFPSVRTHSISAQSGSSLTSFADFAIELKEIYDKPVKHLTSPVRVRPSPAPQRRKEARGSESADDILLPQSLLQSTQSKPEKRIVSTIVPVHPAKKPKNEK